MAFSTKVKSAINRMLAPENLRIDSRTESRAEEDRFARLMKRGYFERPAFPLPKSFAEADGRAIFAALPEFQERFDAFRDPSRNDVGFSFANDYFRSPDAEVFYTLVRTQKPKRIIEIGSGHSTKIARQAIRDGNLDAKLISIDPKPRTEIGSLADEWIRQRVEDLDPALFDELAPRDILFIDSSHEVRIGNDGAFLYSIVLPRIGNGVLVQIHDVFLPYDYPSDLMAKGAGSWNEQHLVHALLMFGETVEVIWPGYFIQRTRADFASWFPSNNGERAQSLWLRKVAPKVC